MMLCSVLGSGKSDEARQPMKLSDYELSLNSVGNGKGIATFFKSEKASHEIDVQKPRYQITKLSTDEVDVFNIYRSKGADDLELMNTITSLINQKKTSIICGDINACFVTERNNHVTQMLESIGFTQLVEWATHYKGGHIDHVYSNHDQTKFQVDVMMYSPYYTSKDHDALCVTVRHCDRTRRNRR